MFQSFLSDNFFRQKFIHYFVIILSFVFLFTLGPRILADQFTQKNPNTATAQDCGQTACPTVPPTQPPAQPPQECTTSCPADTTGTCGGHKYWVEAEGHYGDCQCETAAQTCQAPTQPPQPTSPPATTPPATTPPATTPPHVCSGTPCDRPVGESTCSNHHQIFCKQDAPECGGEGCNCMVDTGSTCGGGGGSNPTPAPTTPPATATPGPAETATPAPAMTATPAPASTATPVPPVGGSSSSNSSSNATAIAQQQQSQSTNINNVNNNNNTNNNTQSVQVMGVATTAPTSVPAPTVTATPVVTTTNGTTTIIVGQGGGAVVQPTVVGKTQVQGQVQELPNTGLPVAGLSLIALAPLGWKLRRFGLKHFTNASSIWAERELKK